MKYSLLLVIGVIFLANVVTAQVGVSCTDAIEQASVIVASAQTLLTEGNRQGASTLLETAQTLLDTCVDDASSTITESTIEATSEAIQAPLTTSYTLIQPIINEGGSIAFVRFAHASVDAGPIDIYMGRDNVLVVSNLNLGEFTDFIAVNSGDISFRAREHGAGADSQVLYQLRWNYGGNSSWIVTAIGIRERVAFTVEPISVIRNAYRDQARVRIVNVVAGAPRLTVSTDSGVVLGNRLGWVGVQDNMLAAGTYNLQFSSDNGGSLPDGPLVADFAANNTYTLFVTGRGTAEQPLQVLNIVSQADTTYVRFVNNSSSPVDIHYRPGTARLVENLAAGAETSWIGLPSGAVTFITYAPNTGPTGRELAANSVQLRPARYLEFSISDSRIQTISERLNEAQE